MNPDGQLHEKEFLFYHSRHYHQAAPFSDILKAYNKKLEECIKFLLDEPVK